MESIIIIGASGHGKVVAESVLLENKYRIHGFVDTYLDKNNSNIGIAVLGSEQIIPKLMDEGINKGIIAIGDNLTRKKMLEKVLLVAPDFDFISVIHPSATISKSVKIGKGTAILPGVIVNAGSKIGEHCILNTKSSLGHDGNMADYSSLAPGVTTGGNVSIGDCTALSISSNVLHGINIGSNCVIGAGALVTKNIGNNKLVYGIPAKEVRDLRNGEKYL